jgi:hypothetical protein
MNTQIIRLIFDISDCALREQSSDFDQDVIPEIGCNVFDSATTVQKYCLIITSVLHLFDESDRTMLIDASLAAILEYLAMEIEFEHDEFAESIYFRKLAYETFLSKRSKKDIYREMLQFNRENPESEFKDEVMFFRKKWNLKNVDFWRNYVIESFFATLDICDRDYQTTSINPGMIEGGDDIKDLIGLDDCYLDFSIPRFTKKDARILFKKFTLVKNEFESGILIVKSKAE